jgi:hypothetical protein
MTDDLLYIIIPALLFIILVPSTYRLRYISYGLSIAAFRIIIVKFLKIKVFGGLFFIVFFCSFSLSFFGFAIKHTQQMEH